MLGFTTIQIHCDDTTTFSTCPVYDGSWAVEVKIEGESGSKVLCVSRNAAQALRDALDEILVGVPTPPEDEVVGLTTEEREV